MTVDSPLALFTTLLGWQFYNTIWDVLLGTGIALIPFLGVLIEVFVTDREDGDSVGNDPAHHFRRLEAQILIMLGVVAIGAQPANFQATSLGPTTLSYIPYPTILEPDPVVATTTDSDSTFGETALRTTDDNIPVPVWWYSVMAVSQGINRAVIEGFPEVESIRDGLRLAQIARINDPALATETSDFYSECFIPARSQFLRDKPAGIDADDVSFMGAQFYVEGAYVTLRARNKVRGFPFDPARDTDLSPEFNHQAGKPTCAQWWLGDGAEGREGLRGELLAAAEESAPGFSQFLLAVPFIGDDEENVVIKRLLTNSDVSFSNDSFRTFSADSNSATDEQIESLVGRVVNSGGTVITSRLFSLFIDIVTLGVPMVQPLILMAIFALLPFVLVASRYSLSGLVGGAIVIFTVSFWPVLWYIATFVDDQLVRAMFPEDGGIFEGFEDFDTRKNLLGMITSSMILFLPAVFSALMGIAGIRAVTATAALTRNFGSGGEGVAKGAGSAQAAGGGLSRAATGKFGKAVR